MKNKKYVVLFSTSHTLLTKTEAQNVIAKKLETSDWGIEDVIVARVVPATKAWTIVIRDDHRKVLLDDDGGL